MQPQHTRRMVSAAVLLVECVVVFVKEVDGIAVTIVGVEGAGICCCTLSLGVNDSNEGEGTATVMDSVVTGDGVFLGVTANGTTSCTCTL
jgi:hypothetical protein